MGLRFSYHQWAIFGGGRKHAGAKKGGIAKLDRISTDWGGCEEDSHDPETGRKILPTPLAPFCACQGGNGGRRRQNGAPTNRDAACEQVWRGKTMISDDGDVSWPPPSDALFPAPQDLHADVGVRGWYAGFPWACAGRPQRAACGLPPTVRRKDNGLRTTPLGPPSRTGSPIRPLQFRDGRFGVTPRS